MLVVLEQIIGTIFAILLMVLVVKVISDFCNLILRTIFLGRKGVLMMKDRFAKRQEKERKQHIKWLKERGHYDTNGKMPKSPVCEEYLPNLKAHGCMTCTHYNRKQNICECKECKGYGKKVTPSKHTKCKFWLY